MHITCQLLRICATALVTPMFVDGENSIKTLKNSLMKAYDKNIRPVHGNDHAPIKINLSLNLFQILEINEREESVKLYLWNRQTWFDKRLGWDSKMFNGIRKMYLPFDQVWVPDAALYNGFETSESKTNVLLTTVPSPDSSNQTSASMGFVRFMFRGIYTLSCDFEVRYFPFDHQNCSLVFGSWIHDSSEMIFSSESSSVRTESYIPSEEWTFISFEVREKMKWYNCCSSPFSEIHCHLVIRRKPLYYIVSLIIPTIMISVIAAFGCFTPVSSSGERTEKVNLGITTLLAMAVLLMVVSDHMPTTSKIVPLINVFFLANMLLIAAGTVFASIIIIVQQQGHYGREVPELVRKLFFNHLAPLVCMTPPTPWKKEIIRRKTQGSKHLNIPLSSGASPQVATPEIYNNSGKSGQTNDKCSSMQSLDSVSLHLSLVEKLIESNKASVRIGFANVCKELKVLASLLRPMKVSHEISQKDAAIMLEWEFISVVMDKILLALFMVIIFITVAVFFAVGLLSLS